MTAAKIFQVGPSQVRVRRQPSLQGEMIRWLDPGTQIQCDSGSRREADGYVWWQHADGWSAERTLSGSEVYLFAAAAAPTPSAPDQLLLRVGSAQVRVRSQPNLGGAMIRWLQPGELVEVSASSRREADGYVWWQHADGWSAERSLDGTAIFLIEVPATPAVPAPTPTTAPPAAPTPAMPTATAPTAPAPAPSVPGESQPTPLKKAFKVAGVKVRIRQQPNLQGEMLGWLEPGTLLDADGNSRQETDGYVWWRHNSGWSAERNLDGSELYLVDPSVEVQLSASSSNEPPTVETLPRRDALFQQLPVTFDKILWWQYFGNNVYAWRIWKQGLTWYRYAQGLHGGLDFGNSREPGVQVRAGVQGVFKYHDRAYTKPNGLWVTVGEYTVIYGHVANPRLFRAGDPIGPDTVMGELEFGGQNHLHLEVRYRDKWIINPLLLLPETMRDSLIRRFPPNNRYFFQDANWNQWQTPLDQPIITLGGPLVGPNAR